MEARLVLTSKVSTWEVVARVVFIQAVSLDSPIFEVRTMGMNLMPSHFFSRVANAGGRIYAFNIFIAYKASIHNHVVYDVGKKGRVF